MTGSVDLRTSLLLDGVEAEAGRLEGYPGWETAIRAARDAVAERLPAPGGGFRLRMDADGRTDVHVFDLPSLSRLEHAVGMAAARHDRSDLIQVVEEHAATPWRAVQECFYGERWSSESRAAVLAAATQHGASAYVYGPSADRRTGDLWRELYTGPLREELRAFAAEASARGVRPIWRVSPAAPLQPTAALRPADDEDVSALLKKIDDMLDLGFESVLIAFDDITAGLDAVSAGRFADSRHPLASAHASVVNRVAAHVGAEQVLACPTHYWAPAPSAYRRTFGESLGDGIMVCWTGPAVISDAITTAETVAVAEEVGHDLWLWDNYPVNDWDVLTIGSAGFHGQSGLDNMVTPRRLPLAPLRAREAGLLDAVRGYGANASIDPLSGIPALRTALDFSWSGPRYSADRSWHAALLATGLDLRAMSLLADATGPLAGGVRAGVPLLARACARVLGAEREEWDDALQQLDAVISEHREAIARLRETPGPLLNELRPWLHELARQCTLATLAHRALTGSARDRTALAIELAEALARPSSVAAAIGGARPLAEYARGLVGGGAPELP